MKKTLKELLPAIIATSFWVIYLGICYLIFKDKVTFITLVTLLLASALSLLIVVIGEIIINFVSKVNNSLKNEEPEQDASIQIKMWSLEHPPWM